MTTTDPAPRIDFGSHIGRSVSLDDAANLLGVSRRTIYNRIRNGRLQTIRTLGGSQRVLVVSLVVATTSDRSLRSSSRSSLNG